MTAPEPKSVVTGGRDLIGNSWADDGYEWIGAAESEGWRAISAWGSNGWDLGDWPYMVYAFRGDLEVASYCEGDVRIETYESAHDRELAVDAAAMFYWKSRDEPWLTDGTPPGKLMGPYSAKRKRCSVCHAPLTPLEESALARDVDFVNHGDDQHLIRWSRPTIVR